MKVFKNRFLSNTSWMVGGKLFQMALSLLIGVLTARYLGVSNFGLLNYSASIVAFFAPICTLGLNVIIVNELIKNKDKQGTILGSAMFMRLILGFISMGMILIIIYTLNPNDNLLLNIAFLQSISLLFNACDFINYWYQSKLQSKFSVIIQSIGYIIMSVYRIVILVLGKGIVWFAFATTLDVIVISILLLIVYHINNGPKLRFSLKTSTDLLKKSYHFIVSGIMVTAYGQMDKVMIGMFMDSTAVGLYSVAIIISGLWGFIPTAVIESARPIIIEHKKNNQNLYILRLKQLYAVVFWLGVVFSLFITIFSEWIILLLYGSQYVGAKSALVISAWYTSFGFIGSCKNIWLICEDKSKYEQIFTFCGAVSNLILNLLFIPLWGISGAAIATLFTQIFTNFIMPLFFKETKINSKYMLKAFLLKDIFDKNSLIAFCQKILSRK
ncbi:flippase [Peribacillus sp. Hz7]|uniref:flippase n=1 Tax=Peribacillus sp. Hz7 TaxID=3344873 RepID=UPI0035CAC156